LLRAPVLPIERYMGREEVREKVAAHGFRVADAVVRRALSVGSTSLLEALDRGPKDARDADRLAGKLHRFLVRMSTRPTPYGTTGLPLAWDRVVPVAGR